MVEKTQTEVSRTMKLVVVTCWVVTMGVGFLNLVLFREVGLAAIAIAGGAPQLAALLDKVIFFLFGVGGLAIIILSEAAYRKGAEAGRLVLRFTTVSTLQFLAIALCSLILRTTPGLAESARTPVWIVVGSLTLAALLIVLRQTVWKRV